MPAPKRVKRTDVRPRPLQVLYLARFAERFPLSCCASGSL